eukprot:TRINITY_DN15912_c0_g1_i1.p1 TRINITY_DN15912_c0_g1~~TRINITY_DN15912_c0_g1_i1.p1  ORF type:complete len:417 (+),score=84.25 TRINITY_DN15912_c0_g1_i1:438-1688(+)
MNNHGGPSRDGDEEEEDPSQQSFLDAADLANEVPFDDEELPPADDEDDDGASGMGDDDQGMGSDGPNDREDEDEEEDDAIQIFRGHSDPVYAVACSPSRMGLVATGGGDDVAFLWGIGETEEHKKLTGHTDSVACLEFSHDGALLATGGLDGAVLVWDAQSGELRNRLEGPAEGIEWLEWHPRGHVLLAGAEDSTSWLWNADSGTFMATLVGHSASVTCGGFTPDGKAIVTGSADASLRFWNPRSGESVGVVAGYGFHTEGLTSLHMASSDLGLIMTGSTDKRAGLVSLATKKAVTLLEGHEGSVECVGLCSAGIPIGASGSMDGKLCLWDITAGQLRSTCEHPDGVTHLLWHPVLPAVLFTGCLDGGIRMWDARTATCQRHFRGHRDSVQNLATTADGSFVLSGSDDKTARVFGM